MVSLSSAVRLMLNASVYYMDINDMQVEKAVNQIESYMTNAAEATGKGNVF